MIRMVIENQVTKDHGLFEALAVDEKNGHIYFTAKEEREESILTVPYWVQPDGNDLALLTRARGDRNIPTPDLTLLH